MNPNLRQQQQQQQHQFKINDQRLSHQSVANVESKTPSPVQTMKIPKNLHSNKESPKKAEENSNQKQSNVIHHESSTEYSFMLPDLSRVDDYELRECMHSELIDTSVMCALNESGHLNWWTTGDWENICRPIYPMMTSGDGNCLLHAASLAMWGVHDRHLIMRKALNANLLKIEECKSPFWRRWKWYQMCQNRKSGLIYDEQEWAKEWQSLLKLSSYEPRTYNLSKNDEG
jgi:OTU domain-containing protein 7